MPRRSVWLVVLLGGSVAGALDLLFATTFARFNGAPATRVLQTVASGLLGEASYSGGAVSAALGLLLHFAISYGWAAAFLLASWRFPRLARRPFASGAAFGTGVFLAMRLVVLPLSAFPHPIRFAPLATVLDLLSHALLFGVPIALAARSASRER